MASSNPLITAYAELYASNKLEALRTIMPFIDYVMTLDLPKHTNQALTQRDVLQLMKTSICVQGIANKILTRVRASGIEGVQTSMVWLPLTEHQLLQQRVLNNDTVPVAAASPVPRAVSRLETKLQVKQKDLKDSTERLANLAKQAETAKTEFDKVKLAINKHRQAEITDAQFNQWSKEMSRLQKKVEAWQKQLDSANESHREEFDENEQLKLTISDLNSKLGGTLKEAAKSDSSDEDDSGSESESEDDEEKQGDTPAVDDSPPEAQLTPPAPAPAPAPVFSPTSSLKKKKSGKRGRKPRGGKSTPAYKFAPPPMSPEEMAEKNDLDKYEPTPKKPRARK